MHTYDIFFLFAFLPVYMGIYALTPPKRRSWVMTAGNIVFAVSGGLFCMTMYIVCTICAYFSGIAVYNMRTDRSKERLRRAVVVGNCILAAAVLLAGSPRGIAIGALAPFKAAMLAVMPLHMISYITDVYRGECEAQTSLAQLAAYTGFFPSAGYGPVLRYNTVRSGFAEPKTDVSRLSEGIRYYILGLAAYVVIARRLSELHRELLGTPVSQLRGGTAVMGIFVYYAWFGTAVIGSVFMGHGLSEMQGINSGHSFRRRFMQPRTDRRLCEFNMPLCRWLRDYVTMPLRRAGVKKAYAFSVAVILGALWYDLSVGWLTGALLLCLMGAAQSALNKKRKRGEQHYIIGSLYAKLATLLAVACGAVWELGHGRATVELLRSGSVGDDLFYTFFSEALLPTLIGLLIAGSMLHSLIKRMNLRWFKLVLPVAELMFLAIATAYMVR